MDETRVKNYVEMVGKETFVTFYEQLADFTQPEQVVAEFIASELGCTYDNALGFRVKPARRIIQAGQSRAAMLLISDSVRLPSHIVESAARIAKSLEGAGNS